MKSNYAQLDITRVTFALLVLAFLLVGTFWVLHPFLPALIWAVTITIASWPLMLKIQQRLRGSRAGAVFVMTVGLLLLLIIPLSVALSTLINNFGEITDFAQSIAQQGVPEPPAWLRDIPLVGERLATRLERLAHTGREEVLGKIAPYVGNFLTWLIGQIGGLGMLFIHFLLTVILSAILFAKGEVAARGALRLAKRLSEDQGEKALILASQAIRAVAMGIVVTAIIQTALAGAGMYVADVPYTTILTSIIFLFSVIQIGAVPVLILVIIYLYGHSTNFTASAFLIWSIVVGLVDNLVRPLLIKSGADLPLLLIFAGVIGGLIAFGVIGLFIGPVILAISFTLLNAWIEAGKKES